MDIMVESRFRQGKLICYFTSVSQYLKWSIESKGELESRRRYIEVIYRVEVRDKPNHWPKIQVQLASC